MKKMIVLFAAILSFGISCKKTKPINALIITGGHDFERAPFFEMFSSFDNLTYKEAIQPAANQWIENGKANDYDLLIFYDMYDSITEPQKEAYIELFQKGKPALFLHHSLVSYQNWDEFIHIIGGKYNSVDSLSGVSVYKHDVAISVEISQENHPITVGLSDFEIFDETYGNCPILETVEPLLATNHPESMPYLGWINAYGNSKIVYLQPGHGIGIYKDPNYKKLVHQAINWVVENNN